MRTYMNVVSECLSLRNKTGAGLQDCKKAIEYSEAHEGCTPIGYLKAKGLAVATPGMSFEDRVKKFSEGEQEYYESKR